MFFDILAKDKVLGTDRDQGGVRGAVPLGLRSRRRRDPDGGLGDRHQAFELDHLGPEVFLALALLPLGFLQLGTSDSIAWNRFSAPAS